MRKLGLLISALLLTALPVHAQDMFPLASAQIVRAPQDVAAWPVTNTLVALDISSSDIGVTTAKPVTWPDTPDFRTPQCPDCMGPLQYTIWVCVQNPTWQCAGVVQMWKDRPRAALPSLPSHWSLWWGPEAGGAVNGIFGTYIAKPGDTIGIFLAAGDERGGSNSQVVKERTNVVMVPLVAGDTQFLTFSGQAAPPPDALPQTGNTPPNPSGRPIVTFSRDIDLDIMDDDVKALKVTLDAATQDIAVLSERLDDLLKRVGVLDAKPIPVTCAASVFGVPIHCALR